MAQKFKCTDHCSRLSPHRLRTEHKLSRHPWGSPVFSRPLVSPSEKFLLRVSSPFWIFENPEKAMGILPPLSHTRVPTHCTMHVISGIPGAPLKPLHATHGAVDLPVRSFALICALPGKRSAPCLPPPLTQDQRDNGRWVPSPGRQGHEAPPDDLLHPTLRTILLPSRGLSNGAASTEASFLTLGSRHGLTHRSRGCTPGSKHLPNVPPAHGPLLAELPCHHPECPSS